MLSAILILGCELALLAVSYACGLAYPASVFSRSYEYTPGVSARQKDWAATIRGTAGAFLVVNVSVLLLAFAMIRLVK